MCNKSHRSKQLNFTAGSQNMAFTSPGFLSLLQYLLACFDLWVQTRFISGANVIRKGFSLLKYTQKTNTNVNNSNNARRLGGRNLPDTHLPEPLFLSLQKLLVTSKHSSSWSNFVNYLGNSTSFTHSWARNLITGSSCSDIVTTGIENRKKWCSTAFTTYNIAVEYLLIENI